MNPTRLRECLALIDWSQRKLARKLGLGTPTTVQQWAGGAVSIPHAVATWLEHLARAHAERPLPEGWTRRRDES